MKTRLRIALVGMVLPVALLVAWHVAASRPGEVVFPRLASVWHVVAHPTEKPETIDAPSLAFSAKTSLLRIAIGYVLAAGLAIPLGLLMGRLRIAHEVMAPLTTMLRVVCPIAWLPAAIVVIGAASLAEHIWGPGQAWQHETLEEVQPAMVLIIAWGAFFPILLASSSGARSVRNALLETAWLTGMGRTGRFFCVTLPYALPSIVNGMRIGLGISWMVIVAAELYPGTRSGLGYTIWVSHDTVQYEYTFAAIAYIMLIGLILDGGLWSLERRVSHWQAVQR